MSQSNLDKTVYGTYFFKQTRPFTFRKILRLGKTSLISI